MHASQQTYIQRLGFQDPDRNNTRHGLACEYLLRHLIDQAYQEANRNQPESPSNYWHETLRACVTDWAPKPSRCLNVPITNHKYVNGFADVLVPCRIYWGEPRKTLAPSMRNWEYTDGGHYWAENCRALGEVKIAKEPAERVLQQINFYRQYVQVSKVAIVLDYEDHQLERMVKGSDIKVYRLGDRFEKWCEDQKRAPVASTPEL